MIDVFFVTLFRGITGLISYANVADINRKGITNGPERATLPVTSSCNLEFQILTRIRACRTFRRVLHACLDVVAVHYVC